MNVAEVVHCESCGRKPTEFRETKYKNERIHAAYLCDECFSEFKEKAERKLDELVVLMFASNLCEIEIITGRNFRQADKVNP